MKITDIMLFGDAINGGNSGGYAKFPLMIKHLDTELALYCGPIVKKNTFTFVDGDTSITFMRIGDYMAISDGLGAALYCHMLGQSPSGGSTQMLATDVNAVDGSFMIFSEGGVVAAGFDDNAAEAVGMPSGGIYVNVDEVTVTLPWIMMLIPPKA